MQFTLHSTFRRTFVLRLYLVSPCHVRQLALTERIQHQQPGPGSKACMLRSAACLLRRGRHQNRLQLHAGKRLPLYGVVGATFLLGGYVFFFNTAKHPESTASTSRKNQQLPGESHNKQAEDYQKNQPTRKLTQAAGKNEGDANIFPNNEAGKKMSDVKDK